VDNAAAAATSVDVKERKKERKKNIKLKYTYLILLKSIFPRLGLRPKNKIHQKSTYALSI